MSRKNKFSLFPELSSLKNTLWEVQGQFAETKPQLDAALSKLAPKGIATPLDELEEAAKLQLTGKIPASLQESIDQARDMYRQADEMLADKGTREKIIRGEYDQEIQDLLVSVVSPNYDSLFALYEELPSLAYGAEAIEKQHIMETRIGVMNIVLNRGFELMDLRPPFQISAEKILEFFEGLTIRLANLVDSPLMQPTWDLLSAWMARWENRPELRETVTRNIPIGSVRMLNSKNIDNYRKGDRVADLKLYFGKLSSVRVIGGLLPLGLELNATSGSIQVSDPKRLFPGVFSDIRLAVENDQGFKGELDLGEIEFGMDFEATYTVFSPKNLNQMEPGEMLAYPTDPDGTMVGAQILGGNYPPGTRFNTRSGELTLHDPAKAIAGTYTLKIATIDEKGGRTDHEISLVFERSEEPVSAVYVLEPYYQLPLPKLFLLAKPQVSSGEVLGAAVTRGKLLPGMQLNARGEISVVDTTLLSPGIVSVDIALTLSGDQIIVLPLYFELKGDLNTPPVTGFYVAEPSYQLPLPKLFLLARPQVSSGEVLGATLTRGKLLPGMQLNSKGEVSVADTIVLSPGIVSVDVTLTLSGAQTIVLPLNFELKGDPKTTSSTSTDQSDSPPASQMYYMTQGFYHLPLSEGFLIAMIEGAPGPIDSAKVATGFLPPGLDLLKSGQVMVTNGAMLMPGRYDLTVSFSIQGGPSMFLPLSFEIMGQMNPPMTAF